MPSGLADDGITRNPHLVVAVNVAPDEPPIKMRWLREKLVQVSKTPCTDNYH